MKKLKTFEITTLIVSIIIWLYPSIIAHIYFWQVEPNKPKALIISFVITVVILVLLFCVNMIVWGVDYQSRVNN